MKKRLLVLSAVVALFAAVPANAALTPGASGLINDTTLNITWLQDANLVKTSCDANNALWQAFDPSALPAPEQSGRTKSDICNTWDGRLNWYEAEAWIGIMNAQSYLGYNDWRQPVITQPDATCSLADPSGQNYGFRCTGSELGHLFNVSLGNPNELDNSCFGVDRFGVDPYCLQNTGPFSNMQSFGYWSGTEYAPLPANAWSFYTSYGLQGTASKASSDLSVWPVRGGRSTASLVLPKPFQRWVVSV